MLFNQQLIKDKENEGQGGTELEESFFHPGFPHFFLRYLLMVPESYSPTTNLLPPMTARALL